MRKGAIVRPSAMLRLAAANSPLNYAGPTKYHSGGKRPREPRAAFSELPVAPVEFLWSLNLTAFADRFKIPTVLFLL